jgi:hypothetical protein
MTGRGKIVRRIAKKPFALDAVGFLGMMRASLAMDLT